MSTESKCPFHHFAGGGRTNTDWWPNHLKVELLNQHSSRSNPMAQDFNYAKEFKSIDYAALKNDVAAVMKDSEGWGAAGFRHFGPLLLRLGWALARAAPSGRGGGG